MTRRPSRGQSATSCVSRTSWWEVSRPSTYSVAPPRWRWASTSVACAGWPCETSRRTWPTTSSGPDEAVTGVEATVGAAVRGLTGLLTATWPVEAYARREELTGPVREGLERQLGEQLLETLIDRAILPRYAFPTDVVSFWVSRAR